MQITISGSAMSRQTRRVATAAAGFLLAVASLPGKAADVTHVVLPGENPWIISARLLRSMDLWPRLVAYNRIGDAMRLAPGTVLHIPEPWLARRNQPARVLAVEGEASLTDSQGRQTPLKTGDRVPAGSLLKTTAESSLSLGLVDRSRILVKSNSDLRLEANSDSASAGSRSVVLDLQRGGLENEIERRSSSGGRFEIRTPAGTAAVRGTTFRVVASEAGTSAEVLSGAVKLHNRVGAVNLAAGFATAIAQKAAPAAPRALLPAPDLTALPLRVERVPADLPLPALAGAVAYRTQIARDESFSALLFDKTAQSPVARVRDLPDGDYLLRVRGIDASGFEGFDARHRMTIDARPEPPFLISPGDGAKIGDPRPAFRWTARQAAVTYRFQLARDGGFADLLFDKPDIAGETVALDADLPAGEYFWRVAAIESGNDQGPFSDLQRLRRVPGAPAVDVQQDKDGKPAIRWRPGAPDERFQLQIARDAGFATPVVDMTLTTTDAALPTLDPGRYLLRARTIAGDGYVGEWGAVQQFEVRSRVSPALLLLLIPLLLGM